MKFKSESKCKAELNAKNHQEKQKQDLAAVTYCLENGRKSKKQQVKAALNTGYVPLVKDHKTIT